LLLAKYNFRKILQSLGNYQNRQVELKEVIEKATIKKEIIVKGAKGTRKKNEW
jgi:hypothetical protein